MPRGPRITYPGAVFHVLNRFVDRHPFFRRDDDYKMFLETFIEEARNFSMLIFGYDLLPNHFHIILQDENGKISHFLQRFLSRVAQRLNQMRGRTGHLFQGRSKTLLIDTDNYFETGLGYVLLNRVRAGLAKDIFEDKWNSVREMLTRDRSCLARDELWGYLFGRAFDTGNPERELTRCRCWLRSLDVETNRKRFQDAHRGSFLGSENFRARVLRQIERRKIDRSAARRRKLDRKPHIQLTKEMIRTACEKSVCADDLGRAWKNTQTAVNHLEWFLLYTEALWTLDQIRNRCCEDGVDHSRVSMAIRAIRDSDSKTTVAAKVRDFIYTTAAKTAKLQV